MDEQNTPPRFAGGEPSEAQAPSAPRKKYEPPRIVQVENVRDLVAGGVGSRPDARGRSVFS